MLHRPMTRMTRKIHVIHVTLALFALVLLVPRAMGDRVLHVTIEGDLDSTKLAMDFADLLSDPTPTRAVIVETGANVWRPDVIWHIVDASRQAQTPLIVFLRDKSDGRFGVGALVLAILADSAAVGPRTSFGAQPDDDASDMVPPQTDRERVDRELGGLLWVALKRRGLDPSVGEVLLSGSGTLWVADNGAGLPEIVPEPPVSGGHRMIEVRADGSVLGGLDVTNLLMLGLIDAEAADATHLARDEGLSGIHIDRVRLKSGVGPSRGQILRAIRQIDESLADVRRELDAVRRPLDDRVVTRSAYRRGGRIAQRRLGEITGLLQEAERRFQEHPELLSTPAPEGTPVGRTPERNVSDWRRVFQDRRRELGFLEDRARDYLRR